MKPIIACLTLGFLASALPAVAQMPSAPDAAAPRPALSAAEITKILAKLNAIGLRRGNGGFNITPQEKARVEAGTARYNELDHAATEALHNRNFAAAEIDYRELVQIDSDIPNEYYGLAEALVGQGRIMEALAVYKRVVYWPLNIDPQALAVMQARDTPSPRDCNLPVYAVAWMKYALLLSQTGQNAEAFAVYSQALHVATLMAHPDLKPLSGTEQPTPTELQAAAHIALGLLVNDTSCDPEQAMSEFAQARALAPDAAAANYYYGYGWQRLDRSSPTRAANALQAKAALSKAAASEDENVKQAAMEALQRIP
jgi:tetratricopeptide (TPR) repeat protein